MQSFSRQGIAEAGFALLFWLNENLPFWLAFSRQGIAETSFALLFWLNENVPFRLASLATCTQGEHFVKPTGQWSRTAQQAAVILQILHGKAHTIVRGVFLCIDREAATTDIVFGLDFNRDDLVVPLNDKLHFGCSR